MTPNTTRWARMGRCPTCDALCCENRLTSTRSLHKRRCPATHHTCDCAYGYVEVPLKTATTRVPLPFRCQPSAPIMGISLAEDGLSALVTAPVDAIITLKQTYGASPSLTSPDPYLALHLKVDATSLTLFWNGDGTFDGWDCSAEPLPRGARAPTPKRTVTA